MRWPVVRLVTAWTVTHFGYRAALIALPLLVLEETGSAWALGLVAGAAGLPTITAPWWTRRLQRRITSAAWLALLLAAEGVATLVVPAAAVAGRLSPEVMIGSGLAVGLLNAVSGPLDSALLAALGDRRDPRHGAARLLAVQDTGVRLAMTLAPLATLPLIALVGSAATVALEGMLSLVGALLVATVRLSAHTDTDAEVPRVRDLLSRHPVIRAGWLVRGAGCAAWFAFPLGLSVLGIEQGRGVLLATVGLTAYAAGSLAGSALGVAAVRCARPSLLNAGTWMVAGLGWLTIAARPTPLVIGAAAVVMGLVVPAGNAATTALVTRSTIGLERRSALTAQATVVVGASTLGSLVGGPLIATFGARATIGGAGAMVLLVASVVAAAHRELRPAPEPAVLRTAVTPADRAAA
jgi:MFS family permease